jgi:tryptophanyl-tRNA synthetase
MTATTTSTAPTPSSSLEQHSNTGPGAAPRRLTGLKPTGHQQIGNLFGAIRPMVAAQDDAESVIFIADLHALTVEHDPSEVHALTMELASILLAAGVDPRRSILFAQSQLPEHTELHYLLECVTGYGEVHRMIQFKEKSTGPGQVRLSLLTYPVLMAADILLHDTEEVPVGRDQSQHLELTRDIATRFNHRYGETFVLPRGVNPRVAARIMDLARPGEKMGKSGPSGGPAPENGSHDGTVFILDPPAVVRRKVGRAVTDGEREVRYDPVAKPGVSNLLEIFAVCQAGSGQDPAELAAGFSSYGELKTAVADAVCETLRPIQQRQAELALDPAYLNQVLAEGAERARETAAATVRRAKRALGLRPA